MSDLDQQLADALEANGLGEYAWDPAPTCPSGHPVNLPWQLEPEKGFQIGELCPDCLFMVHHFTTRDRDAHEDDLAFHPEWRIGRVPKRLSEDATTLLAAAEAWCEREDAGYEVARYAMRREYDDDGMPFIVEPTHFASVGFHAKAEWTAEANNGTEALARALLAALKGGSDD